uniref:Uncharacterized protein n=1 Tax=Romanomermis culicivorax TaxID=13658 RepID=A0A915IR97_ROMCU
MHNTGRKCTLDERHYRGLGNWSAFRDLEHPYPYLPYSPLDHILMSIRPVDDQGLNGLYDDPSNNDCIAPVSTRVDDPLWTRSLCPWHWKENRDINRVPSIVLEAECLCDRSYVVWPRELSERRSARRAWSRRRRGTADHRREKRQRPLLKTEYECQKVYYKVRVLRFDDRCEYKPVYEEFAMSCATLVSAWAPAATGQVVTRDKASVDVN